MADAAAPSATYAAPLSAAERAEAAALTQDEQVALAHLKTGVAEGAAAYLDAHPEVAGIVQDFTTALLAAKPADAVAFARTYFAERKDSK
jgi:hypothetical protein